MNQFGPWCDNGFNQRGVSLCVELLTGDTLLLFSKVDDDEVARGVILICKCLLLRVLPVSYARIYLSISRWPGLIPIIGHLNITQVVVDDDFNWIKSGVSGEPNCKW